MKIFRYVYDHGMELSKKSPKNVILTNISDPLSSPIFQIKFFFFFILFQSQTTFLNK